MERDNDDENLLLANPGAGGGVSGDRSLVCRSDPSQLRGSVVKKTRPKSPSMLKFFLRSSRKSEEVEDSACTATEETVTIHSQRSLPAQSLSCSPPDTSRFSRNLRAYVTMPYRSHRKVRTGSKSEMSESKLHEVKTTSTAVEDEKSDKSTVVGRDRPVGMEALEALHNQIQIMVKQECEDDEKYLSSLHEATVTSLRHQLDDMQQTLDLLRISDSNLRLELSNAEQRAYEAESRLSRAKERNKLLEQVLLKMAQKYENLVEKDNSCLYTKLQVKSHDHLKEPPQYYSPQIRHPTRGIGGLVASPETPPRPSSAQGTRNSSSVETFV